MKAVAKVGTSQGFLGVQRRQRAPGGVADMEGCMDVAVLGCYIQDASWQGG